MTFETTALLVTWVVLALFGLALAGLLRQVHALTVGRGLRVSPIGPAIGSVAPSLGDDFEYPRTHQTLLLFADAGCASCQEVLAAYAALAGRGVLNSAEYLAVFSGSAAAFVRDGIRVLENREESFAAFPVPATPFAVLVTKEGTVDRAAPVGSAQTLSEFISSGTKGAPR